MIRIRDDRIKWLSGERKEAVDILNGVIPFSNLSFSYPQNGYGVNIGFSAEDASQEAIPSILLLGKDRRDFFSWISTFAEDLFPVSASARVMLYSDWEKIENIDSEFSFRKTPIWPSVILGEMLGQYTGEVDVSTVPIGRANACLSFSMARSEVLYGGKDFVRTEVVRRLVFAGRDTSFAKRPIPIEILAKIWSLPQQLRSVPSDQYASISMLMSIIGAANQGAASLLRSSEALFSDSAEDRVAGFDAVVDSLISARYGSDSAKEKAVIAVAAAALLAGRGTSHISLLSPLSADYPEILVWYGFFAGVLGPKYWDNYWHRVVKGVDKLLRQPFRLDEPVQADLCWPEFEWLLDTFSSDEVWVDLPKIAPRNVAVELFPGVPCQFRLNVRGAFADGMNNQSLSPAGPSQQAIREAMVHLVAAQHLLLSESAEKPQTELFSQLPSGKSVKPRTSATSKRIKK